MYIYIYMHTYVWVCQSQMCLLMLPMDIHRHPVHTYAFSRRYRRLHHTCILSNVITATANHPPVISIFIDEDHSPSWLVYGIVLPTLTIPID